MSQPNFYHTWLGLIKKLSFFVLLYFHNFIFKSEFGQNNSWGGLQFSWGRGAGASQEGVPTGPIGSVTKALPMHSNLMAATIVSIAATIHQPPI